MNTSLESTIEYVVMNNARAIVAYGTIDTAQVEAYTRTVPQTGYSITFYNKTVGVEK